MILLSFLLACGIDLGDAYSLGDVTIVATIATPPAVYPSETLDVEVHIANPEGRELEALVWLCFPVDGRCLESNLPVRSWTRALDVADGLVVTRFSGIDSGNLPTGAASVTTFLHTLVCPVGMCPVIEDVRTAPVISDDRLGEILADPEALLAQIPMAGTSYAVRSLEVLLRPSDKRNWNPKLTPSFSHGNRVTAPSGTSNALIFDVTDANGDPATGYGYTTLGSWVDAKESVTGSRLTLEWVTPDSPENGRIFVVVEDRKGGVAIWRSEARSL